MNSFVSPVVSQRWGRSPFVSQSLAAQLSLRNALFAIVGVALAVSSTAQADQWKSRWKLNACSKQQDCLATELCDNGTCYPTYSITPLSDPSSAQPKNISAQRYEQMIHDGIRRWTTDVKACKLRIQAKYAGTKSLTAGATALADQYPLNTIQVPTNWPPTLGSMVLGYTSMTKIDDKKTITAANVIMNPTTQWMDSPPGDTFADGYSFETVLVHELGHFFGLTHTAYPLNVIMYATAQYGFTNLTPTRYDLEDICGLYPPAKPGLGQGCDLPEQLVDCDPNMECLASTASGARRICTTTCSDEGGYCSDPAYSCRRAGPGDGEGKFGCFLPGPPTDTCKLCSADKDCQAGRCVKNSRGSADAGICVSRCFSSFDCGANENCTAPTSFETNQQILALHCMPMDFCSSYRCTADAGCLGGQSCIDGICISPGKENESCAATNTCQPGLTCSTAGTSKICKPGGPLGCTCSTGPAVTDLFWLPAAYFLLRRRRAKR